MVLLSPAWDQIAYFLNPFEQGEVFHPGLMAAAQGFVDGVGLGINWGIRKQGSEYFFSDFPRAGRAAQPAA